MSSAPQDLLEMSSTAESANIKGPSEQQWLAGNGPRIGNGTVGGNFGLNIVNNSNQGDCESSCTTASFPVEKKQLYKKNAAAAFAPGNEISTSANASPSGHSILAQHASPAFPHPMTRQGSPRTPVRRPILRPATERSSPTSPTLTTPPLSPSSSVSSQDSADESFHTFASGDRGRYVRPDTSSFVSTPPISPTKTKGVEVRMLAADDADEDELALLALTPVAAGDGAAVVPVRVEEVPYAPASSNAVHDLRAEMFAIWRSGDSSRYGRALQISRELGVPQRPVKVEVVVADPDEYETRYSADDAAWALLYDAKEIVVEVTVETVVSYDAPAEGHFPQARAYAEPPSPSSSTSSFDDSDPDTFRLPATPPPSRASLASPARSSTTDEDPLSLRSWSTVDEFAALVRDVVADSQARFRPLAESVDLQSRRSSDAEPVELEAVGSASGSTGLFKRPRRLRDVVRAMPLSLSSPWKGSVKQGFEKAKKWAKILGSRRPSLDDAAQ